MGTLLLGLGAVLLGFLLIALLSLTAPSSKAAGGSGSLPGAERGSGASWLAALPSPQLAGLVAELLAELKVDVLETRALPEGFELLAVNPSPLTGGRLYIRGLWGGVEPVDEEAARTALDAGRAEGVSKVVVFARVFTEAARAVQDEGALELVDCPALERLVERYLPAHAAAGRAAHPAPA